MHVKKMHIMIAIAAGLLAVLSAQQQSFAQYDNAGTAGVSEATLQKCIDLEIEKAQCTEASALLAERVAMTEGAGSGTAFIAKETGQMVTFIGVLGGIFGAVAGAFFMMGRTKQVKSA